MNNNFVQGLQEEDDYTFTDNGAKAYKSTGSKLADFVWLISSRDQEKLAEAFDAVDPAVALQMLFWLRDPRNGQGERDSFRYLFEQKIIRPLLNKPPESGFLKIASELLMLIGKYGRWDDAIYILDKVHDVELDTAKLFFSASVTVIEKLLKDDIANCDAGKPVSLLAKWLPSINTSSKDTVKMAWWLIKELKISPKVYRKTLSKLRNHIDVVERKMCDDKWGEIKYEAVPSKANLTYKDAFLKHDEVRRRAFLEALTKGNTKINAGALFPHDIILKYENASGDAVDTVLEEMWKALPDTQICNTLVVRDGSGSMTNRFNSKSSLCPMIVANALTVYATEHNKGELAGQFVTFSENPRFVDIRKCKTLKAKLKKINSETEVANTNIERTFDLILDVAIRQHCKQEDLPDNLLIISDMQFDEARSGNWNDALFKTISKKFETAGYKIPRIVFWNLCGKPSPVPMKKNELGLLLVSGFSQTLFDMVASGDLDPEKAILRTLEKYADVKELAQKLAEAK